MNIIEFTDLLKQPTGISRVQTDEISTIVETFPYFQAAHFLHLNGLKKQSSFKYNIALKKTAAYTTDRAVLFDFITKDKFDFDAMNLAVDEVEKENDHQPLVEENTTPESESQPEPETNQEENTKETTTTLPIGQPLNFKSDDKLSFNEWLQLSQFKPIERSDSDDTKPTSIKGKSLKNIDLIDKFIESNPKISPIGQHPIENISSDSVTENQHLMTETLAHVYLEQKKYKKAITAFKILSLKYPEKSSFFANQIKEIEKLL